jgi:hypothetical protein
LPVDVEVTNGEEGEELLFEMRSKSFQLVTTHDDDNGRNAIRPKGNAPTSFHVGPAVVFDGANYCCCC